ncbi:MAG: hypothetical protein K6V97_10305 [Actinomycetia bacterium]|nr:hypothetical protein [Actinomycetes bacterium]
MRSMLYAPNTPTLIEPMGGPRHVASEAALRQVGAAWAGRIRTLVVMSPHFATRGGFGVDPRPDPPQIFDFYGFPEIYRQPYRPPGAPELARALLAAADRAGLPVAATDRWGVDHGAWVPLRHVFPAADVPVLVVSVAADQPPEVFFRLGQVIREVADDSVAFVLTGSIIHRLDLWDGRDKTAPAAAEAFRRRLLTIMAEGRWADLDRVPAEEIRAAAPEGGFAVYYALAGAAGSDLRGTVLAQEGEFGAASLDTVQFEAVAPAA